MPKSSIDRGNGLRAIGAAINPHRHWLPTMAIASALLLASIIPIPATVPVESGTGLSMTAPLHVIGYGVLALVLVAPLDRGGHIQRPILGAIVLATGYGALIELLQAGLPYRTASLFDALLNAIGAGLAGLISFFRRR